MRNASSIVIALSTVAACTTSDPEEPGETVTAQSVTAVGLCDAPFTTPTFTRPADDGVALSTLLEGAGYGAPSNSDWVDIASGNLCGGAEKELLLLKNERFDFSVLRGPTPFPVAGFDFVTDAANPWRAVAAGNLDADAFDEIVAVRALTVDGVPDVIVAKADPTSCFMTTPLAQAQVGTATNSDWVDVAIGTFAAGKTKMIALLRTGGPSLSLLQLVGGTLKTVPAPDLAPSPFPWRALAAGDLDGDGIDELVAARQVNDGRTSTVIAFKWTGTAFQPFASSTFGNTGNSSWTGMTIGDFNGDGKAAIVLTKNAHSNFAVLDVVPGQATLRILRAADLDTASGQSWRGLTSVDWLGTDAGAKELIAVRAAKAPDRADLFVYGNAYHRAQRDSAITNVKGAFDQTVDGSQTALPPGALIDALRATHTNMLTWSITRPHEYTSFVKFLDATQLTCIDGRHLRVGLMLIPPAAVDNGDPAQAPEDASETPWNELDLFKNDPTPRQKAKDYRAWGTLLGRLAQQYPHLVAVQIDDFMNHPDAFAEEEVAEMQANMRSRAPWLNFVAVTYSNNITKVPDIARTVDTLMFYFRNDLGPLPPSPPFDPQCIEGACGEQSVWRAPFEIAQVQAFMPAGRKLHLGSYWGSLNVHPEGTPRYDFDLMRLMMSIPNIGGVQQYPQMPAPPACDEFNFTSNKSCILQRLYGGTLRPITHTDLSVLSGATLAAGDPFGFVFPQAGVQNVVYRDANNHAHELWRTSTAAGHTDLTAAAPGAPAVQGNVRAYVWDPAGTQNVVYRGTDGHVHGLFWTTGAVGHDNLTALAGAPLAAGAPYPYVDGSAGTQNLLYRGVDGHVHGLFWAFGAVGHDDLSGLAHATNASGDPFGFMFNGATQNALYRATDGQLHGLFWSQGPVGNDNLTGLAAAPGPAADARAYISTNDGLQHAIYAGTDGHVHELFWAFGGVGHGDLTNASHAPPPASGANPAGFFVASDGTQHVVYRDNLGHVRELSWTVGGVADDDLTGVSHAPLAAGDPSAYVATDGSRHIVYRAGDGHIHEIMH